MRWPTELVGGNEVVGGRTAGGGTGVMVPPPVFPMLEPNPFAY
jgi:hypothetical protein